MRVSTLLKLHRAAPLIAGASILAFPPVLLLLGLLLVSEGAWFWGVFLTVFELGALLMIAIGTYGTEYTRISHWLERRAEAEQAELEEEEGERKAEKGPVVF